MSDKDEATPFFKTQKFLKLRFAWYEKLKKDGKFVDIEFHDQVTGETLPICTGMSASDLCKMRGRWGESKIEYYRLAEQHRRRVQMRFPKKSWQYKAWHMHSEGVGTRSIAVKLGMKGGEVVRFIKREADLILKAQQNDDIEGAL